MQPANQLHAHFVKLLSVPRIFIIYFTPNNLVYDMHYIQSRATIIANKINAIVTECLFRF